MRLLATSEPAHPRRDSHHSRAFWNSRSQGPGPLASRPSSEGYHGFCHIRKQRSGCGIMARWRPSVEHSAAMPSGEPLGLKGYWVVGEPSLSQYLRGEPRAGRRNGREIVSVDAGGGSTGEGEAAKRRLLAQQALACSSLWGMSCERNGRQDMRALPLPLFSKSLTLLSAQTL